MASKLSLYNAANLILGERKLRALNENRPSRRRLDTWWDGGGVKECLEEAFWNHAMRTVSLTYSPSVTPSFGYTFAFDKPSDWCRTFQLSDDPTFCNLLTDFDDKGVYLFAWSDTIYLKYVSNDANYGMDLSQWPEKFTNFVAHSAADKVCKATTNSSADKDEIAKARKKALNVARSIDAMNQAPQQIPAGSWSRARRGNGSGGNDRGNPGQLLG